MDAVTAHRRRWWTLAALCASVVVISVDNTILNVALPGLQRELDATTSQLQWVLDAYMLVFACLLLAAGSLGDRFGRRRALHAGLVVFGVGSALAAFSGSADLLTASRALMGVGGALIMPSTLSILTNVFAGAERARAIGIWAGVTGLGIAFGPVIGGWLMEHYWWGSVFLVNVPIVCLALVAGYLVVPESKDPAADRPDPLGALLSVVGVGALVYGVIEAPVDGWTSPLVLSAFAASGLALALFVAWERRTDHPMLRLTYFRDARFSAASLSIALVFFALLGSLFVLTQYLQLVLGYTALESGVRTMPVALGLALGAPLSAKLAVRVGDTVVVAAGMLITAAGLGVLALATADSGYLPVLTAVLLQGLGIGLAMATATESVMGSVPQDKAGVGSAMNDTTRLVGGALGVAVLGTVLTEAYQAALPTAAGTPAVARSSLAGALEAASAVGGPAGQQLASAARTAFVDAMGTTALVAAGVAVLGASVAARFLPPRAAEEVPPLVVPVQQLRTELPPTIAVARAALDERVGSRS